MQSAVRHIVLITLFSVALALELYAQENIFSHFFVAGTCLNPAHAGDTRFAQIQVAERIQPTVSGVLLTNSLVSYDQKLRNHRAGIGISFNQETSRYKEQHVKANYSHTVVLFRKFWIKGGLGISLNSLNTQAGNLQFADQYNNYGYTGEPTQESLSGEKAIYPGVSAGLAAFIDNSWITIGVDNINRPGIQILGDKYRAPFILFASTGYLFPIDKQKRGKRLFSRNGGLMPYSSIGPVATFYKNGPFHAFTLGLNAFTKPVFWGVNFRYNAIYSDYFTDGVASLNLLAGYRIENISLAYSYAVSYTHLTLPTN